MGSSGGPSGKRDGGIFQLEPIPGKECTFFVKFKLKVYIMHFDTSNYTYTTLNKITITKLYNQNWVYLINPNLLLTTTCDQIQSVDLCSYETRTPVKIQRFSGEVIVMPQFDQVAFPYVLIKVGGEWLVFDVNVEQVTGKIDGLLAK